MIFHRARGGLAVRFFTASALLGLSKLSTRLSGRPRQHRVSGLRPGSLRNVHRPDYRGTVKFRNGLWDQDLSGQQIDGLAWVSIPCAKLVCRVPPRPLELEQVVGPIPAPFADRRV